MSIYRYKCCSHCEGCFCVGAVHGHEQPCDRWGCWGPVAHDVPRPVKCGHCGFVGLGERVPCAVCCGMLCRTCASLPLHPLDRPPVLVVWEAS